MNLYAEIYDIVRQIPFGRVTTYGQIARLVGNPRLARVVGYALSAAPPAAQLPCHRVVNRFGELARAFGWGGRLEQRALLEAESVEFDEYGRVCMARFMWHGPELIPQEECTQ